MATKKNKDMGNSTQVKSDTVKISKKAVVLFSLLLVCVVFIIYVNNECKQVKEGIKIGKKLEKEYNYECKDFNIVRFTVRNMIFRENIDTMYCDSKDKKSLVTFIFNSKDKNKKGRIEVKYSTIIDDGVFHITSEDYYYMTSEDNKYGAKPPTFTNYFDSGFKGNRLSCYYSTSKNRLEVNKELTFDFWNDKKNMDGLDDQENIYYCEDKLDKINEKKAEFEKYFENTEIKLGK